MEVNIPLSTSSSSLHLRCGIICGMGKLATDIYTFKKPVRKEFNG